MTNDETVFLFSPHSLLVMVLSCSALSRMRVFFVLCCLGVDNRLLHVPLCMHVCWVFVLAHLRWSGSARRCSFRRRGASTGSRSPWNLSTRRCEKQENTTKGKRETDEPTPGEWRNHYYYVSIFHLTGNRLIHRRLVEQKKAASNFFWRFCTDAGAFFRPSAGLRFCDVYVSPCCWNMCRVGKDEFDP